MGAVFICSFFGSALLAINSPSTQKNIFYEKDVTISKSKKVIIGCYCIGELIWVRGSEGEMKVMCNTGHVDLFLLHLAVTLGVMLKVHL